MERHVARILILLALLITSPAMAESPKSFKTAKKWIADIHTKIGHETTFYCGCPYSRTTESGGVLDMEACGLKARKNEKRADDLEWEHITPAAWIGGHLACWTTGHAKCSEPGRECCNKSGVNDAFRYAHNDLNNLFPSGGEVNGDRSDHPYGTVDNEPREYGACDFEVGGSPKRAEVADSLKGVIARALLHMATHRGARIPYDLDKLKQDSADDPPEAWEIKRARKIADKTGIRNVHILGDCDGAMTMRCGATRSFP